MKDRVLEYLQISSLKNQSIGFSFCLFGDTGSGKETCARAISTALNRPFAVLSMRGMTDETLKACKKRSGAIVDALIATKCMNPVIYFQEYDALDHDPEKDAGKELRTELRKILTSGDD